MSQRAKMTEMDGAGPSAALWNQFPVDEIFTHQDNSVGIGLYDDFVGFGIAKDLATNTATYVSNGILYKSFEDDAGVTVAVPTTTPAVDANGPSVIVLTPGAHAGDDVILQAGGGTLTPFNVVHATAKELIFECRFKLSSIVASSTNLFIGLGGTGAVANDGVRADSSGVLASNNFLGFCRNGTATSGLTFTYQRVSGTEATHADVATIVADTYCKAGFRFKPDTGICEVWFDGANVHEVTHAQTAATPWPTLWMNFIAEVKYAATGSHGLYIDWWKCGQLV